YIAPRNREDHAGLVPAKRTCSLNHMNNYAFGREHVLPGPEQARARLAASGTNCVIDKIVETITR
ncbi:MAG: hypothetical protein ACE5GZ_09670, partial [Gammaproteobacteria bacterium]